MGHSCWHGLLCIIHLQKQRGNWQVQYLQRLLLESISSGKL